MSNIYVNLRGEAVSVGYASGKTGGQMTEQPNRPVRLVHSAPTKIGPSLKHLTLR